jgi:hypothetical protein
MIAKLLSLVYYFTLLKKYTGYRKCRPWQSAARGGPPPPPPPRYATEATDSWIEKVDSGHYVGALMIDLSKAFDSVPHQKLINDLYDIGCEASTLQ